MNKEFNLTSRQYADLLGISPENLRSRRRREIKTNFILDNQNKYWWKDDRPIISKNNENDRPELSLVSGQKVRDQKPPVARARNRGALARGEKPNYPNWKMEQYNRLKALTKIQGGLKEDFTDEEITQFMVQAKKAVIKKNSELADKHLNTPLGPMEGVPYGVDHTPPKYGSMLKAKGLKIVEERKMSADFHKWEAHTKVKFAGVGLPDFSPHEPRQDYRNSYYEVGGSTDDGSVEIDTSRLTDDREPTFKDKIEESIWRLKNSK